MNPKHPATNISIVLVLCLLVAAAYSFGAYIQSIVPAETAAPSPGVWDEFVANSSAVAFLTPLPKPVSAPLDGTYAKIDQSWPQWWSCLRCADYRPAGGIWKLQFDRGVMRIYYEVTGWRSVVSYTVTGERVFIFNDPYCPNAVGEFRWHMQGGDLTLELVQDACAFGLRAESLTRQTWLACPASLPDGEAGATLPSGCAVAIAPAPAETSAPHALTVRVLGADARFFARPPDVFAHANRADMTPPTGIDIRFDHGSIPDGLQRVIWWNAPWIEATTELPFSAIGVQFIGKKQIGWARVLFDGVEVWRGNISAIWSSYDRHGGYVEVSGFAPGLHTIRVEALGFDYRPVTVASFGFGYGQAVP